MHDDACDGVNVQKPQHGQTYAGNWAKKRMMFVQDYKLAISASIISDSSEDKALSRDKLKQIFSDMKAGVGLLSETPQASRLARYHATVIPRQESCPTLGEKRSCQE